MESGNSRILISKCFYLIPNCSAGIERVHRLLLSSPNLKPETG